MKRIVLSIIVVIALSVSAVAQQMNYVGGVLSQAFSSSADCSGNAAYVVTLNLNNNDATAGVVLTNNTGGNTVNFYASADYKRSWTAVSAIAWSALTATPAAYTQTSGGFTLDVAGKTNVCVAISSYVSGSVTVVMVSTPTRAVSVTPSSESLFATNLNQPILADANRLRVSTFNDSFVLPNTLSLQTLTATAAVNNQTTLTLAAPPPGKYNYVCMIKFVASQDATATANVNAVTTSTNFNSYAIKFSLAATADAVYETVDTMSVPLLGCARSDLPGTATTFVSPAATANTAFSWRATYYQAS